MELSNTNSKLYRFFNWAQGRTTAFCMLFFVCGNVFHYYKTLDATYIAFMTALMGFVLGHSIKEDRAEKAAEKSPDPDAGGSK